jgi:hypothetical protein
VVQADVEALEQILADDFMLIDLMGRTTSKEPFLAVMKSGQLRFEVLEASEVMVRIYDGAAVLVGRTRMTARQGDASFFGKSRFTHVYVKQGSQWRMVAAQGTQIVSE